MKKIKVIFRIIIFLLILFFFLTLYLNITNHNLGNLAAYIFAILFIIVFILNIYKMNKGMEEERKDDVLYADLEELNLPKFRIDEKDTWMNYTVWDSVKEQYYSLPFPIRIMHSDEWYTTLYYIKDVIFVNCRNVEDSWRGICKDFNEGKSIYTLDWECFEGYLEYGEIVKNNASEKEVLPNTKIETKEVWELEEEIESDV